MVTFDLVQDSGHREITKYNMKPQNLPIDFLNHIAECVMLLDDLSLPQK